MSTKTRPQRVSAEQCKEPTWRISLRGVLQLPSLDAPAACQTIPCRSGNWPMSPLQSPLPWNASPCPRKKRRSRKRKPRKPQTRSKGAKTAKPAIPTRAAFDELRQRANAGDCQAQAELRQLLDAEPGLFQQLGSLAGHAESNLFRLVADGDFVVTESLRRQADELRRQLTPPFPGPLELLGIRRVVIAPGCCCTTLRPNVRKVREDVPTARLWLKRQEQAAKLYHLAVKSLILIQQHLAGNLAPADGAAVRDGTVAALPRSNGHVNRVVHWSNAGIPRSEVPLSARQVENTAADVAAYRLWKRRATRQAAAPECWRK